MHNYLFEVERNSINNFELDTRYDARKSFYGKAKDGVVTIYGKWSQTTTRHQNEFKKQFSA